MINCPICEQQIVGFDNYASVRGLIFGKYRCKNGCYCHITDAINEQRIEIFGEVIYLYKLNFNDYDMKDAFEKANERIAYWRENDRYLTKIMG